MRERQTDFIRQQMGMNVKDFAVFLGVSPMKVKKAIAGEEIDPKEFELLRILKKALKLDPMLPGKIKRPQDWRWKNIFIILKTVYEKEG
jgi:hypothetical protein